MTATECLTKTCSKCLQTQPTSSFHKDRGRSDGLNGWCKTCRSRIPAKPRAWPSPPAQPVAEKKCCTCREVKPAAAFCPDRTKPTGLTSLCKACRNAYTRAYRATLNR